MTDRVLHGLRAGDRLEVEHLQRARRAGDATALRRSAGLLRPWRGSRSSTRAADRGTAALVSQRSTAGIGGGFRPWSLDGQVCPVFRSEDTINGMAISPWPPLAPAEDLQPGREMSIQEWLDLPEDTEGELVDGRLVEEEVPDALHESALVWLSTVLKNWLGVRGFVLGSELKTLTREKTGRKPDLTVYLAGSPAPPRRGPIRRPADILVEVVSPSARDERRDRVEKMAEYATFGVPYYWLLDPALGSFEIFERNADANYVKVVGATDGRVDPVPGCPGLCIDLDALWTDLARLANPEAGPDTPES